MIIILIIFVIASIFVLRDPSTRRFRLWYVLIAANVLLFLSPLIRAFIASLPDGNMFGDNDAGAILWSYFFIIPLCIILFAVLVLLEKKIKGEK